LSRALTDFHTLYGKGRASASPAVSSTEAFAVKVFPGHARGIFQARAAPGPHPRPQLREQANAFSDLQAPRGRGTPRA